MSDYRINVRFHDDNAEERRAAEYLKTLHRSRNQFVVDAVLARILQQYRLANQLKYVSVIVSSLPVLMLYPFVQKYFAQGVMIGSLKE